MSEMTGNILIIGYGNPGRQDDGLGPALAEAMERRALPAVSVDSDYQLTVEHAEMASRYDTVIFADATTDAGVPFQYTPIEPGRPGIRFSSHHLTPSDVLALSRDLFSAVPEGYLLAIRGRQFGQFEMSLSPEAQDALDQAVRFLTEQVNLRRQPSNLIDLSS